jgi:hypothetical protein
MTAQSNLKLHKSHMKISKTLRVAAHHLLAAQRSFTQGKNFMLGDRQTETAAQLIN